MGGAYANGVLISHSAAEFGFDFIANFYPRPVVNCRVFMSAPQVPGSWARCKAPTSNTSTDARAEPAGTGWGTAAGSGELGFSPVECLTKSPERAKQTSPGQRRQRPGDVRMATSGGVSAR